MKLRKVKNGSVRIDGRTYIPGRNDYDGRLDGLVMAFQTYEHAGPAVILWGSEAMHRATSEKEFSDACDQDCACVDGVYLWEFWNAIDSGKAPEKACN